MDFTVEENIPGLLILLIFRRPLIVWNGIFYLDVYNLLTLAPVSFDGFSLFTKIYKAV